MKAIQLALLAVLITVTPGASCADFTGPQKIIVLRVQAADSTGTTFTAAQVQQQFDDIATLWGPHSSYSDITLQFQITGLYSLPQNFTTYVDQGDHSSDSAFNKVLSDAVAKAPNGLDWTNLRGVVVYLADTRPNGFHRGVTYPSQNITPPGSSSSISVHPTLVTEDPGESEPTEWGRIAHEVGHELQNGGPAHPSDYNSSFDQMDGEYPAQTGVFERQQTMAYPGWLPASKYVEVHPPTGKAATIWAAENAPSGQPDTQAVKAYLNFGGNSVYYLVSVRKRMLGDELALDSTSSPTDCNSAATPHGIPDCGILIERVVEGGDPNVQDCDPVYGCVNRWVDVLGRGQNPKQLWHQGDAYLSTSYGAASTASDGIQIATRKQVDSDHYDVYVSYNEDVTARPDVGLYNWLRPPGNTYETTDIWIDSPVNGYSPVGMPPDPVDYRYGVWSDLAGGVVPIGNGDNPAVGMVNRLYARVRNFGNQPATNVVVHFDITAPPGLGINGANGFIPLGTVDKTGFPALSSIPPGGTVDVYYNWTPNFPLTPEQIAAGTFFFHTCVRVRLDHVPGEIFFANQDGDGQQENIQYFDATGPSPGAPGAANKAVIQLRNDSPAVAKTFALSVLNDGVPPSWKVEVNGGTPLVTVPPGAVREIPVVAQQGAAEPIGAHHRFRVIASSQINFTSPQHRTPHTEMHTLSGVAFDLGVVRKTKLVCKRVGSIVEGEITGLDPKTKSSARVYVVQYTLEDRRFHFGRGVLAPVQNGKFVARDVPFTGRPFTGRPFTGRGMCLYAGSTNDTSAMSEPFSF
jgi:hypothetical protein